MSFEDIKGQDSAVEILEKSLEKGRIFPNYLFTGPDGAGKFLAAKNFAKAVNCLKEGNKPCDSCISCGKIDSGTHPDVFFIEPKGASSSIAVGQIREAITRAGLKPYEGRTKVFIINNSHSMNVTSANAFLKTLEEPPDNTVFILISRSEKELLPTVASRCHIVKFSAPPREPRIKEPESYSDREELKKKIEFLVSYFRDILLYKTVKDERLLFHANRIDEIKKECERFTEERLEFLIKRAIELGSYVDYNVNPKLIIDVLINEITSATLSTYAVDKRFVHRVGGQGCGG